jgi:hypothetical protein
MSATRHAGMVESGTWRITQKKQDKILKLENIVKTDINN